MFDWLIEVLSLLGVFAGFAFIAYGLVSLPAIVPLHAGLNGIDNYGSKLFPLALFSMVICVFYGGITLVNRYLYRFCHPANADSPVTYHLYQDILRVAKLILVWVTVLFTALYIVAMPINPGATLGIMVILIVISIMCIVYPTEFILANIKK